MLIAGPAAKPQAIAPASVQRAVQVRTRPVRSEAQRARHTRLILAGAMTLLLSAVVIVLLRSGSTGAALFTAVLVNAAILPFAHAPRWSSSSLSTSP